MTSSLRRLFLASALAAGLAGAAGSAVAAPQLGKSAGFAEAFQPDFLARDMDLIVEVLELEDWQRTIVESLLADYQNDFRVGVDGVKDKLKSKGDQIKASGDGNAMGVIMGPISEWSQEKRVLRQRFLDNLRGQLSESQAARWDALERAMLREKELPRGELSGESVNLIALARDVEISPDIAERTKPLMEEYSVALDGALKARASQVAQSTPLIQDALVRQDWNGGLLQVEAIVARRVALRDLQDEYVQKFAAALGPAGADFRERAQRAGYPEAYRPSPMIQWFAAARALPGVSPEQAAGIDSIEAKYVVDYADIENRWAAAIRTEEPKRQVADIRARAAAATGQGEKPNADPYKPLRDERDRLAEAARTAVADLLGQELAMQLPGADKGRGERAAKEMPSKDGADGAGYGKRSPDRDARTKGSLRETSQKGLVPRGSERPATAPSGAE